MKRSLAGIMAGVFTIFIGTFLCYFVRLGILSLFATFLLFCALLYHVAKKTKEKPKKLFLFFICTTILCFLLSYKVNITGRIEGTVVDFKTGEPLEGVQVDCTWFGIQCAFVDTVGKHYKSIRLYTDKNGKFVIPRTWFSDSCMTEYEDMRINTYHWVYLGKHWTWKKREFSEDRIIRKEKVWNT